MKTVFTILKIDVRSNAHTIVSTHANRDIAELLRVRYEQNGRGLVKYVVLENTFDPTEFAQPDRKEGSIYVDGDYFEEGERLWFDVNLEHHQRVENMFDGMIMIEPQRVEVSSIRFCGQDIDKLDISPDLKRGLEHEAENIRENENDKL